MDTSSNTPQVCNPPMIDLIHFNVGGTRFSTTWATLQRIPNSKLGRLQESIHASQLAQTDFFFDRNPAVFGSVLDYYRTGVLHLPETVCGRQIREELAFWEIPAGLVSNCCWRILYKDDGVEKKMRLLDMELPVFPNGMQLIQKAEKMSTTIWNLLEHPSSSLMAKGYLMFYFLVVVVSVIPDMIDVGTLHFIDLTNIVFLVDVFVRFAMSPNKARFFLSVINVLDILALIACAVSVLLTIIILITEAQLSMAVLGALRMLKLVRFYRVLKANRALALLLLAMFKSKRAIFLYVSIMVINCVFVGLLFFAFETTGENSQYIDISESIYWALISMTTIGYGDIYPMSTGGRVLGILCGVSGLVLLALPITAIYNNFTTLYAHNLDRERHVNDIDKCRPSIVPVSQPTHV
ncbi:potassium voltage-gated channel protein Shaw-like [Ylistrum balloti]|uniref:potassium voltage-gated channel protein Shaw-like n=1 Tax=Ylistrum balloti TaxID=509963 RepID=UPI00290584F6|nr:potassium voltage-gated channel protein Shaw-like [Ylistrum balloti]